MSDLFAKYPYAPGNTFTPTSTYASYPFEQPDEPPPPPFNPSDIPGLLLWLDGNDPSTFNSGTISNGQPVSSWTSKDPNSRVYSQATAGMRPVFATNVLNGKSVVQFTNANSQFLAANATFNLFDPSLASQAIVVWYQINDNNEFTLLNFAGPDSSTSQQWGLAPDGGYEDLYFGSSSYHLRMTPITRANTWNATQLGYTGAGTGSTSNFIGVNNEVSVSVLTSPNQGDGDTNCVGTGDPSETSICWNGYVAAVLVYNHVLTTSEQAQMNAYIASQWGL